MCARLSCLTYYGIAGGAGPKFTSCEIRCEVGRQTALSVGADLRHHRRRTGQRVSPDRTPTSNSTRLAGTMIVGILGGTGKEGAALALRLAKAGYAIVIGSRDKTRALEKATELARTSGGNVSGATNADAAARR